MDPKQTLRVEIVAGKAPILISPKDLTLRKRLELKLREYKTRQVGQNEAWACTHPELAYKEQPRYRDAYHKVEVLSALLELKPGEGLNTWDLSLKSAKHIGPNFDVEAFTNACGTMAQYIGMPIGEVLSPGTGLPELPSK